MALTETQKAARILGRLGGLKGGRARADKLTPERRKEIAQEAVAARWSGKKFFAARTIDQLISEQHVLPVADITSLAGSIPDGDMDEFVADLAKSPGVAAFFGTWPGDETDAEMDAYVTELRSQP